MTMPAMPNLYIPGAPKCGTTALADYLSARDDVYLPHVKEPNFWSQDLPGYARREGLDNTDDYLRLYGAADSTHTYRLDASTHYLFSKVAVSRIIETGSDARFVVGVRDPVALSQAWHMQMFNAGYDDVADFREAWSLRKARREGAHVPEHCLEPALLDYEGVALTGRQLQRLLEQVAAERVAVFSIEALKADAALVYRDLLAFLGLPHDGREDFPASNPAFQNRSARLSRLVRHPLLRRTVNRVASRINPATTRTLKAAVKRALYRPARRRDLAADVAADVATTFEPDQAVMRQVLASGVVCLGNTRAPVA